jgi:ribonuclease T2
MSRYDPLNPQQRRRRRRRRGMSGAALVAAALSAVLYQCNQAPKESVPAAESAQAGSRAARERSESNAPRTSTAQGSSAESGSAGKISSTNNFRQAGESFDFYLMALSLHPAFCEDGNANKKDCRVLSADDHARRPLVIHGLWPENLRAEAYPRDCPGPKLSLARELRTRLDDWMPGTMSGLHSHEWRKHGTCSGLDDDAYFEHSIELAERANQALGKTLLANIDRQVSAATLRAAADSVVPGFGATITFHCRNVRSSDPAKRGKPYLIEIRQCVDNDGSGGAPGTPLACSAVQRRDQGCGSQFWIDGV